jgi:8-oxo-dGTP pyrophosphatase MutT (NUDIX family)
MTVLATGVILFRNAPDGPSLLLLRNQDNGHWGFPKGRRDEGDAHEVATALREVEEETGFDGLRLDPCWRREIDYRVQGTADHGKHKRVVYFLAPAPEERPHLSPEHDGWEWAGAARADELLPFAQLRDLARDALARVTARDGQPVPPGSAGG